MIFLVKDGEDVLVFHYESQMQGAGYEKADKKISDEKWSAKGCFARVIDGEIVIGDTDEEKERYVKQHALDAIDAELDALGKKQERSSAEITAAIIEGKEVPGETKKFHTERQKRMEELREQRKKYA